MKTTRRLTCLFTNGFDRSGTLSPKQSGIKPLPRARQGQLAGLLAIGTALCLIALPLKTVESAHAYSLLNSSKVKTNKPQIIDYQIYALQKIRSIRQFNCAITLWNRESNWRVTARNGNHYGIPQGKSHYLKNANYKEQINWGLSYIAARYGYDHRVPNVCAALAHSYSKWWY